MKKIVVVICLVFMTTFAHAQGYIGFRDTQYLFGGYRFKFGLTLDAEHSIYLVHPRWQKGRLYVGYQHEWKYVDIEAKAYGSTLWDGSYQDAGALIKGVAKPFSIWTIDATLNPHYDTGYGYQTNFSVGTGVKVYKDIALLVHYTTIPEYRVSEKRIRAGVKFSVLNLEVQPEVSFPLQGTEINMRMLFTMRYTFKQQ